jgi:hypothetical protein
MRGGDMLLERIEIVEGAIADNIAVAKTTIVPLSGILRDRPEPVRS